MGKRIIAQRRGRGTPTYKAPSHRYKGKITYPTLQKTQLKGTVKDIINDPARSAPLAIIKFEDQTENLIPAPEGLRVNDPVDYGTNAPPKEGNILTLSAIPEGTLIYAIENTPGSNPNLCTSSGTFAKIISKKSKKIIIELPSKKQKIFNPECRATIGIVSGGGRVKKPFVKAGKKWHALHARGKLYPRTSGVAMNVADHPFGSGRGRHPGKTTIAPRYAPPGRKVGLIRPKKTGRGK